MTRRLPLFAALAAAFLGLLPGLAGVARADYGNPAAKGPLKAITFPAIGKVSFSDDFHAPRSGHLHEGNDIMGTKMLPEVAAVDGTVTYLTIPQASYGYALTVTGDDGWSYHYLHINNDTPGTDDGKAELKDVFAPGIEKGARVAAGQLVAFMGDSGNAESTGPHLHFEIHDPDDNPVNPFASLTAAPHLAAPGAPAVQVPDLPRVAGSDRVATAIAASKAGWSSSANAVLAAGDRYAEALPATVLAAKLNGPLLLADATGAPKAVLDELRRLHASAVTVVGSVPVAADTQLRAAGLTVTRIGGTDPVTNAVAIADTVGLGTTASAVVVNAEKFADGISASALAAGRGWPILLASDHGVPDATVAALSARKVSTTYLVGGVAVLDDTVASLVPHAVRLAGDNRYGTSVAVAGEVLDLGGRSLSRTYLATGNAYPDALAAGALAAKTKGVLLLVDGNGGVADGATEAFIEDHAGETQLKGILGGLVAVDAESTVSIAHMFGIEG